MSSQGGMSRGNCAQQMSSWFYRLCLQRHICAARFAETQTRTSRNRLSSVCFNRAVLVAFSCHRHLIITQFCSYGQLLVSLSGYKSAWLSHLLPPHALLLSTSVCSSLQRCDVTASNHMLTLLSKLTAHLERHVTLDIIRSRVCFQCQTRWHVDFCNIWILIYIVRIGFKRGRQWHLYDVYRVHVMQAACFSKFKTK